MKQQSRERLQMRYAILAADYVEVFCLKHGFDFDGWVGDEIGGMGSFGDFYFNYDVIRYDIDHNVRKGTLIRWYDAELQHNAEREVPQHINYSSWCKGLRHKDLGKKRRLTVAQKEELARIQEKQNALKEEIKRLCEKSNPFRQVVGDENCTNSFMDNMLFCNKCDRITKHEYAVCTECNN